MADEVFISVQPTPTYDAFETVTLSAGVGESHYGGHFMLTKVLTLQQATALARQLDEAVERVIQDQARAVSG